MPRRNRNPGPDRGRSVSGVGWQQVESGADGEWVVRAVSATGTTKAYRCPGCDHEVQPGTAHLVIWPADELGTVADRRHWHQGCWRARLRRHPTRKK